jgi:proteic killer suppression protein
VIRSFAHDLAFDLFHDRLSKATRRFPPGLRRVAQRKLQFLNAAVQLKDLSSPPGNRLEALKGDLTGYYSIRINDQWRILFHWESAGASDVRIDDYH